MTHRFPPPPTINYTYPTALLRARDHVVTLVLYSILQIITYKHQASMV